MLIFFCKSCGNSWYEILAPDRPASSASLYELNTKMFVFFEPL